jgi:predicted nucleotidyltransferase component of viral defense system
MNNSSYRNQVNLLLESLPYIAKENCFALKGGTAINLFVREFPRLSVDIDLTYLGNEPRNEALIKTEEALHRIKINLENNLDAKVVGSSKKSQETDIKLFVSSQNAQIKIEASPVMRGTIHKTQLLNLQKKVVDEFEKDVSIQVVSLPDLYGGKIAAALDRQHPRDLFDIKLLLQNEGITEEIRFGFIIYLLCHNRPPQELLKPQLIDQKNLFNSEFEGMTNIGFNYDDFIETRNTLIQKINLDLTVNEKQFLISFFKNQPNWGLFKYPNLQNLPAVKWKLLNLSKLSPDKLTDQAIKLSLTLKI